MPKRFLIALAVIAIAVAACSSGSSSPSPTIPPGSPLPNPNDHMANIKVTINGTPAAKIPVEASTPRSTSSPRPGTPFETLNTNHKGVVHFKKLKPSQTYCWVAKLGSGQSSSECTTWLLWQSGQIVLGT
jgi:hypothetical protein